MPYRPLPGLIVGFSIKRRAGIFVQQGLTSERIHVVANSRRGQALLIALTCANRLPAVNVDARRPIPALGRNDKTSARQIPLIHHPNGLYLALVVTHKDEDL
jgi:hypothetical protein